MWRGAISFGMVAIPVRMYLATESHGVSFRMLCPSCNQPIKNRRWCPTEDKEVAWHETVRGYEVARDEYVLINDEDLANLPLPTSKTIEILEFVENTAIDAGVYLKGAYYLEPEKVGAKPYRLLMSALEQTGRVAVGRVALSNREHLCRLALHEGGILLNTLHWPDEIRDAGELNAPEDIPLEKRELDMAVMLVESLATTAFDPEKHQDRYREALLEVVEAKRDSLPAPAAPEAAPAVTDLMAALKASVDAARASRDAPAAEAEQSDAEQRPARRRKAS
jgi:DNA end-binding protein Ku